MYVVRLSDGTLWVPESAVDDAGTIGTAYVKIGPDDPDYQRLLEQSITEEELERRRAEWRAGDEALRRQFEEWKAEQDSSN
ncbi:MAG: hypothetical protein GEV11_30095 [Streptosporangiales bacterium]|nr:hypothetical protein [Streptosporangiales bacterium]